MSEAIGNNKAVLVTGGSYGVGAATALAFARAGYDVAVTATRLENLDRTVAAVRAAGRQVVPAVLDLNSQASIEAAMAEAREKLGRLDVLVNNASAHGRKPAIDITREDWEHVFKANLDGTFFVTQAFARPLIEAGRPGSIINITSTHAIVGRRIRVMYGVSKAAINHMTRMLAVEWAEAGIRVNAIAPGRMITDSPSRQETGSDPAYIERMKASIPMHRLPEAEEVAEAALFLASDAAATITGQILAIDGGLTVV